MAVALIQQPADVGYSACHVLRTEIIGQNGNNMKLQQMAVYQQPAIANVQRKARSSGALEHARLLETWGSVGL